MKKIMFVIGCLAGGGAERVVASVASALLKKDFEVSILTYYEGQNEYPISEKVNRINISKGDIKTFNNLSSIKKIQKIRKSILKIKPDEIICFLPHSYVFVFLATLFTKYNRILSSAIRSNPREEKGKLSKIYNKLIRYSKRIITQNNGQTTCFSKKMQSKISVIPNPMYKELFENEKKYNVIPNKIVSVGRLTTQKNYHLAINAFEVISKKYPNMEYFIYGSGNLEKEITNLISEKRLSDRVHLMGFENNRDKIYKDKDIFLMTSKFEGMPNALAEAMCLGVPSISTDCDFGPRDLIMSENMGVLLKDYEVDTLVKAIENVVDNYEKYILIGKEARNILKEKYSFEKIIEMWEKCLSEV